MKILSVLLVTACFSSVVYADNFSYLTDGQKKESMISYRNSKASMCLNDYSAKAAQNNKTMTGQEAKFITQMCECTIDKVIDNLVGKEFILNNNLKVITKKTNTLLNNKDQVMPFIKECAPTKKPDFIK